MSEKPATPSTTALGAQCQLHALNGPLRGQIFTVDRTPFSLGKAPTNNLVLDHNTVSRAHCRLEIEAGSVRVRDLGSTNGTVVDGTLVQFRELGSRGTLSVGALDFRFEVQELAAASVPPRPESFGPLVGRCAAMQAVFRAAREICGTTSPVAIAGPEGSGRRTLARALLALSNQSSRRLRIASASDAEEIHAFATGAFDLSGSGLLFADLHLAPAALRPTLLEALRMHVSGLTVRRLPVRLFLTFSNRAPRAASEFCGECVARVEAASLTMPSLAHRRDDIPLLAEALLARLCAAQQLTPRLTLNSEALQWLEGADYLQEVAGLEQRIRGGALRAMERQDSELVLEDVAPEMTDAGVAFYASESYRTLKANAEARFERSYVRWLLSRHRGNISAAARAAEMDRKYLHKLARKHGLR